MSADHDRPSARRRAFLAARQASTRQRYDSGISSAYDRDWGEISPVHARFLKLVLELTRDRGTVLDAACGTGKYWPLILASGRTLVDVDQSSGMLKIGRAKHPHVPTGCASLQDLFFDSVFDGVICVDALENVGPEDWPTVVHGLAGAARPSAPMYMTVELPDVGQVEAEYEEASADGYPVVPGKSFDGVGHHFYPARAAVLVWLRQAGLNLLEEADDHDYRHLLLRRG